MSGLVVGEKCGSSWPMRRQDRCGGMSWQLCVERSVRIGQVVGEGLGLTNEEAR